MKSRRLILLLLFVFLSVFLFGCRESYTPVSSGKLDNGIEWEVNENTLYIIGNGEMPDFNRYDSEMLPPWQSFENDIVSVEISDGITYIGSFSFAYFENAESVLLPDSAEAIGDYAFFGCKKIYEIDLPENISSIGRCAFSNCFGISDFYVPENVNDIGKNAFLNCTALENIDVDIDNTYYASVDGILFNKDITALIASPAGKRYTGYTVPDTVEKVDDMAFAYSVNLTDIELAKSINNYGIGLFYSCEKLVTAKLPLGIKKIPDEMFFGCSSIEEIDIPAGTASIGEGAFAECTLLKNISLPLSIEKIGGLAFSGCESLETLEIPDAVKKIEYRTFAGCTGLESVEMPLLLEEIDEHAFSYCSNLESLVFDDNLSNIKEYAFRGCAKLRNIEYAGTKEMWNQIEVAGGNDCFKEALVSFVYEDDNEG